MIVWMNVVPNRTVVDSDPGGGGGDTPANFG